MKLRILYFSILLVGICTGILLMSVIPGHRVAASTKQAYKVDLIYQPESGNFPQPMQQRIQSLLDQRASEGWELVNISAWPQSVANEHGGQPAMNVALVFKR